MTLWPQPQRTLKAAALALFGLVLLTGSAPVATAADNPTRSSSLNITIGGRSDPNVERLLPDYTMSYNAPSEWCPY